MLRAWVSVLVVHVAFADYQGSWLGLGPRNASTSPNGTWYDTFTGNLITKERVEDIRRNRLVPYCGIEVKDCDPHEHRRLDHSCNNLHHPARGAVLTPYHRMLPPNHAADGGPRTAKSGRPLPNARALRVALVPDGRVSSKKFTHMITNFAVFVIGDVTSVHDTVNYVAVTTTCCAPGGDLDPRCIPIYVADDDVHLRRSNVRCLNLTRSITYQRLGCVPDTVPRERVNSSPPMLELSNLYGVETDHALSYRDFEGGRLKADRIKGKEWPPSGSPICVNNDRRRNEARCHATETGSNALLGLNLIFIWLYRNHNYIADRLREVNPCWDDEQLYTVARDINTAQYQHVLYYELMATIIGEEYLTKIQVLFPGQLHVEDYDEHLEPRVSLEYVQGTRWFHTLQEGRLNLYDRHGKMFNQLAIVDLTLRTGALTLNNTIEGCTQGAFRQPCASNDHVIDPDMGERVLSRLQFASDVMSADIMKTRDVGLPPYNKYRELCKLPVAKDFHDLFHWMPKEQAEAITAAYEDIDDVDVMAGMLGEDAMPGAVMGPTLACIMSEQLLRWRRADRFWYENSVHPGAFTKEQLHQIKRTSMAKIMCDHGDTVDAIQPNVFRLPGPGNEITSCHHYPPLDYTAWRDHKCNDKHRHDPWHH